MPDLFSDNVNQMVLDYIQQEISEHLFDEWNNSNCDEGMEYAEYRFFEFADDATKQAYNEFYGYKEDDEYYLT